MAYNYISFGYPAQRPGMIKTALWQGPDDDLVLEVGIDDYLGNPQIISLPCSTTSVMGKICLPSSANVTHLTDEACVASLRMHTIISGTIIGSGDWEASVIDQGLIGEQTMDFQTAIGNMKVKELRIIDQNTLEIDLVKKGSSTPVKTLEATRDQFPSQSAYGLSPTVMIDPQTQGECIAGAIEAEFPSYVHNYPTTVLSTAQKAAISTYVLGLSLWV